MIWYDMIWYDMIWYDMIWYDVMWCNVIWYDVIWYDMIWDTHEWYFYLFFLGRFKQSKKWILDDTNGRKRTHVASSTVRFYFMLLFNFFFVRNLKKLDYDFWRRVKWIFCHMKKTLRSFFFICQKKMQIF